VSAAINAVKTLSQETPEARRHRPTVTEAEVKVVYGVWGLILGAAGAIIVGFNWGGWTTLDASQERTEAAVLTARAAICVAQFTKDPNRQQRLKELKAVSTWERAAFIERGGWNRMPGEERGHDIAARKCAEGVGALIEK
jgi:hypothetical protein